MNHKLFYLTCGTVATILGLQMMILTDYGNHLVFADHPNGIFNSLYFGELILLIGLVTLVITWVKPNWFQFLNYLNSIALSALTALFLTRMLQGYTNALWIFTGALLVLFVSIMHPKKGG